MKFRLNYSTDLINQDDEDERDGTSIFLSFLMTSFYAKLNSIIIQKENGNGRERRVK
jgi:hypothetical protein